MLQLVNPKARQEVSNKRLRKLELLLSDLTFLLSASRRQQIQLPDELYWDEAMSITRMSEYRDKLISCLESELTSKWNVVDYVRFLSLRTKSPVTTTTSPSPSPQPSVVWTEHECEGAWNCPYAHCR